MDSLIETISITFSLVSLFLIPVAIFTLLYLIKRDGFYVSVNCWFCNSWTKVLYSQRNSFSCPTCQQYNGFDENGGYNRVIKAQHDTSFVKYKTTQKTERLSNGLCTYCNNNQQLKVYQLAHFVPLNEHNYDVEVEHFQKQLDKSYKLCKKCDKVLKSTIDRQHAWIFGNHLKNLRKKTLSLLNLNTTQRPANKLKQSFFLKSIKFTLVSLLLFTLWSSLDLKISYPVGSFKQSLPDFFVPYVTLVDEFYYVVRNALKSIRLDTNAFNLLLPKNVRIQFNTFAAASCAGFLLETIVLILDRRSKFWKVNELLGWTILIITSAISFHDKYLLYIKTVKVFCSIATIASLLSTRSTPKNSAAKKFKFKKLRKSTEYSDSSDVDEDVSEDASNSSVLSNKSKKSVKSTSCRSPRTSPETFPFQQSTANLNDTFTTARSTNTASVYSCKNSSGSELHHSLDNLHLSNLSFKPQTCVSPILINSASRPILSPPKLKNVTQNSWAAGGFWKNDVTVFPAATDFTNLSRSSSQSSGFVSGNEPVNANPFSSLPPSREPSVCGDFERASIVSEPAYHFKPIYSNSCAKNGFMYTAPQSPTLSLSPKSNQLYYKAENNTFYPILNQNNMLFIQSSNIPRNNFENNFSNLSLKSFNTSCGVNAPSVFGERPVISSLFKNLPGLSPQSHSFRTPHC